MTPRISIIVPTLGRATLARTLSSIAKQLGPRDEVLLIADRSGDVDRVRELVVDPFGDFSDCRWRYSEIDHDSSGPGYLQRTYGIALAHGTHLAFMDDDDVYLTGALNTIRRAVGLNPSRPILFRMRHPLLGDLWKDPVLRYGNVGTPMIVVPNLPEQLGEWAPHEDGRGGDYTFAAGCVERMGAPVWHPAVIADISPAGAAVGSNVMAAR